MVSDGKFKLIRNYNSIEVYDKNLTENENINHFIEIGAKKFSNIPYEELFDLQLDPYEKNNLARNKKYNDIKNIGIFLGSRQQEIHKNILIIKKLLLNLKKYKDLVFNFFVTTEYHEFIKNYFIKR